MDKTLFGEADLGSKFVALVSGEMNMNLLGVARD